MARPERRNADYFPFYSKDGRTLYLLESKYDCKGTGFFTNVMRFLTLETDHHVSIQDETDRMYFFSKCKCDDESAMDMLNIMSKTGKIDKKLWDVMVVASQDLLDSLVDAYRNRKNSIITMAEIRQKCISNTGNVVSCAGNSQEHVVSEVEKPQRILKDIKVNKLKEAGTQTFSLPSAEGINEASKPKLTEYLNLICKELYETKIFPKAIAFKNTMLKKKKSERAILHVLVRAYLKKTFDESGPWAYCEKIIQIENGNFNEREYLKSKK